MEVLFLDPSPWRKEHCAPEKGEEQKAIEASNKCRVLRGRPCRLGREGHRSRSDTNGDFEQWEARPGFLSPSSVASASLVDCANVFSYRVTRDQTSQLRECGKDIGVGGGHKGSSCCQSRYGISLKKI